MQIMSNDQLEVVIVLTRKEALSLFSALTHATEKSTKPLSKQTKAFKIARKIADKMEIW